MKHIILALLIALTFQLHPDKYVFPSLIEDFQYSITANSLNISALNGLRVTFTETRIIFRGCNQNWALYHTGNNGFFEIEPDSWKKTRSSCRVDNDKKLIQLFNQVTNYDYDGFVNKLKNDDGVVMIELTQH